MANQFSIQSLAFPTFVTRSLDLQSLSWMFNIDAQVLTLPHQHKTGCAQLQAHTVIRLCEYHCPPRRPTLFRLADMISLCYPKRYLLLMKQMMLMFSPLTARRTCINPDQRAHCFPFGTPHPSNTIVSISSNLIPLSHSKLAPLPRSHLGHHRSLLSPAALLNFLFE